MKGNERTQRICSIRYHICPSNPNSRTLSWQASLAENLHTHKSQLLYVQQEIGEEHTLTPCPPSPSLLLAERRDY